MSRRRSFLQKEQKKIVTGGRRRGRQQHEQTRILFEARSERDTCGEGGKRSGVRRSGAAMVEPVVGHSGGSRNDVSSIYSDCFETGS